MSTNDWLAQLKEGDEVAVRDGYVYASFHLRPVERVTPSQIIVRGEMYRFRKSDGRGIGTDRQCIVEPAPAVRETIRTVSLVDLFSNEHWEDYPLSVLEQINAVLESHTNAEKEG